MNHQGGPARARNIGAAAASSDILVFIDADVCVHSDTLARISRHFRENRRLDAVFGCYDDSPASPDFLSQYRNLMHRYVHRRGRREASTFWTGCGAVRRRVFEACGGFQESIRRPAMEDVELGYRLRAADRRILLDHDLEVQHWKQWRLCSMVKTDLFYRGVPWVELILRYRFLPNDLNVGAGQRASLAAAALLLAAVAWSIASAPIQASLALAALLFAVLGPYWSEFLSRRQGAAIVGSFTVLLALSAWYHGMLTVAGTIAVSCLAWAVFRRRWRTLFGSLFLGVLTAATAGAAVSAFTAAVPLPAARAAGALTGVIIALNLGFYRFLARRQGILFAAAAVPFHLLYHLNNAAALALGTLKYISGSARPQSAVYAQRQSAGD